jgi:MFS transporter, DHA1 family, inner membrane transport protein
MCKENKYIPVLAIIQFVHILDFVVLMPLGPTLMQYFNISPIQFAGLVSSYNFSAAIAGILFGVIADRFSRRKLLIFFMTGFFLSTLYCGYSSSFRGLLIGRIFAGAFGGVLNAIVYTIVTDLIPEERRGKAMGIIMSSFSIASVIGIPIGLSISDYYNWHYTFYFIGSIAIIVTIACHKVFPPMSSHISKSNARDVIKRYLKILTKKEYVLANFTIFLVSMSVFLIVPFLSPYAVKNIGIKTFDLKYMYGIAGLFTVLTARSFGILSDKWGATKLYCLLAIISSAPILYYTNVGAMSFIGYLFLGVCFMTTVSGRMIPFLTLVSKVPSAGDRGSFMGALNSIRSCGSALATLIAGWLISENSKGELIGFSVTGYLSVAIIIITIYLTLRINKGVALVQKS